MILVAVGFICVLIEIHNINLIAAIFILNPAVIEFFAKQSSF